MKRLALFLDGTWNTVDSRTNVSALHQLVASQDGSIHQLSYYDQGVGTSRNEWLRGGALGYGLSKNVLEAYCWLVENHEDGDEVYIFGFSRGAYTARSVAGMIAKCGLLRPDADISPENLFKRYQYSKESRAIWTIVHDIGQGRGFTKDEARLAAMSRRVPIKMIAVWDTVGALGIPFGNIPGLSRRGLQFHHTRLSNLYEHAYQALALDEHREAFAPTLWTRFAPHVPDPPTAAPRMQPKVEQRWFAGAHGDVGGGSSTALPEIALAWIAGKAQEAGLKFIRLPVPSLEAGSAPLFDSFGKFMWGLYRIVKLGRRYDRRIEATPVRKEKGVVTTVNETIDGSVFDRFRRDRTYRPQSLMIWAARMECDPARLRGAVRAADGTSI